MGARQEQTALVNAPFRDHIDGGCGSHIDANDGGREFFQSGNDICDDIRAHLILPDDMEVQTGFDSGADNHGGTAQQALQRFFHDRV